MGTAGATAAPSSTVGREWKRGWPVVFSGTMGTFRAALHTGTIGTMMEPLSRTYGWSRAEISASVTIICGSILVLGPLSGTLMDRFGPRRVALFGVPLASAALAGIGLSGPGIMTWYLAWLVMGITYPLANAVIWTMGVNQCFSGSRGLALATTMSAIGLANFLSPLIAVAILPVAGWRAVFFALGVGGFLATYPAVVLLFRPDKHAIPASPAPSAADSGTGFAADRDAPASQPGPKAREVIASLRFWSLAVAVMLVTGTVGILMLHFQSIMRDAGFSAATAATIASVVGLAQIAGRLLGGFLLDRLPAHYVAAVFYATPALACLLLLGLNLTTGVALLVGLIIGIALDADDLVSYLAVTYFGRQSYGFVYSLLYGLFAFSYGVAPVIAGWMFDMLGSYTVVLRTMGVAVLFSVVVAMRLGRHPVHQDH